MCWGKPRESLEIARARLTPEQWAQFEREFNDFCVINGLPDKWAYWPTYDWARWAFFQGRQMGELMRETVCEHEWSVMKGTQKECVNCGEVRQYRIADAYFEKIAIAMMGDEQAEQSLERWKEKTR